MTQDGLISQIENYVKTSFENVDRHLSVAHDFKHVDRVRNRAMEIARGEKYENDSIVEITALLHDIGLAFVNDDNVKEGYVTLPPHGPLGADIATGYLQENSELSQDLIERITDAVRHHSDPPPFAREYIDNQGEKGKLLAILRDADAMDALGAVGLMRALTSKAFLPEYDPENIKGEAWDLSQTEFETKFGFSFEQGLPPVHTIIDQINQQIRYFDTLHTKTAKTLSEPLVDFMKRFVVQLDNEIETISRRG